MNERLLKTLGVLSLAAVVTASAFAAELPPLAKAPFSAEQAKDFQQQWAKLIDRPLLHTNSIGMKLTLVPPGEFLMEMTLEQMDEMLTVTKNHPVWRDYYGQKLTWSQLMMPAHRVQSQWQTLMGKDERLTEFTSPDNDFTGPNKAMNDVSWDACQNFIKKLKGNVPKHAFALPTEAQWEYACRAGSTTEFSFGDDTSTMGDYAWFEGNMIWVGKPGFRGRGFYHDVGVKKPNAFGLYDMHGGVWEWCLDWYDKDYYFDSPLVDPRGPETGRFRVLRGGSWFRYAKYARSAYRRPFVPEGSSGGVTYYISDFGCRVVINLP